MRMWLKLYDRAISSGQIYSFDYIRKIIFYDAHVKSIRHTGLVRIILWIDLFLLTPICLGWARRGGCMVGRAASRQGWAVGRLGSRHGFDLRADTHAWMDVRRGSRSRGRSSGELERLSTHWMVKIVDENRGCSGGRILNRQRFWAYPVWKLPINDVDYLVVTAFTHFLPVTKLIEPY